MLAWTFPFPGNRIPAEFQSLVQFFFIFSAEPTNESRCVIPNDIGILGFQLVPNPFITPVFIWQGIQELGFILNYKNFAKLKKSLWFPFQFQPTKLLSQHIHTHFHAYKHGFHWSSRLPPGYTFNVQIRSGRDRQQFGKDGMQGHVWLYIQGYLEQRVPLDSALVYSMKFSTGNAAAYHSQPHE